MGPKKVERRSPVALAILAAVLLAVVLTAVPAQAQVPVTTTQTYTLWNGNTATVVTTTINGVVSTVSYTEVAPSGLVVVQRDIWYYPTGVISRYIEVRTLAGGAYQTTLARQYDTNGIIREQYVKIVSNGVTIAEQFTTYDANGFLLTSETRLLTTLADGSQVWLVTVQAWSAGVLVNSTTAQFPLGTNFSLPAGFAALLGVNPAPSWPGNGKKGDGAPGQDPNGWRPGVGTGDTSHQHYGAPGQKK